MNKKIYLIPLLLLAFMFTSCEETKEVSKYDNWQERNEAFIDSLYNVYTTTADHGGLDSIHLLTAPNDYIFYKTKTPVTNTPLSDNQNEYIEGYVSEKIQPYYTDSIYMYYKGSLVNGDWFDGFKGANPTIFDSLGDSPFKVARLIVGETEILQRMNVGERWEIYIPWKYGYGSSGYESILGYSTLVFDAQLYSIVNRSSNAMVLGIEE